MNHEMDPMTRCSASELSKQNSNATCQERALSLGSTYEVGGPIKRNLVLVNDSGLIFALPFLVEFADLV
jgi:hypothetical protein